MSISASNDAPQQIGSIRLEPRKIKLAYFVSHPIQYQAPLLRQIAAQPDIDLTVYFTSDFSVRGYLDEGFGVRVEWGIPLLDGYRYEFLPKRINSRAHHSRQISAGIFRRLRRNRFDAVWIHGYNTYDSLQAIFASRLLGLPVLLRSDSNLYDRARSPLKLRLKRMFLSALKYASSGVLVCGKANRDYWLHYMGADFPMFDMPYAVDNAFFQERAYAATASREQLRCDLGLTPARPVILFASKLEKRKHCIDLVEAYLRLLALPSDGLPPCLLIIGDGEERAAVEARIRDSGQDGILMLGFRNQHELPQFFDLCDIFVLPSVHEPWGLVVNEVMNAGRPVIVSDAVGCQPDLVQDAVNGCVFPARDVDALTDALRRALHSPKQLARMGRESLRIVHDYSFEQDIAGLREALHTVVPHLRRIAARSVESGGLRILYLGCDHGTSGHRAAAMRRLGHEVTILDPDSLIPANRSVARWKRYTGAIGLAEVVRRRVVQAVGEGGFDLAWVDHGDLISPALVRELKARIPRVLCYNIDDPFGGRDKLLWNQFVKAIPDYDLLVVMRTPNVEEAHRYGARRVMRVLMSADEAAHPPRHLTAADYERWKSEVSFVGTAFPERGPFLAQLVKLGVPLSIYGNRYQLLREWPLLKPYWRQASADSTEDYANAISAAKVCLGLLSKGNRDQHTTRSMEIPALGGVLCAERTPEHMALYKEDKEAVFWSTPEECAAKCAALLADDAWRQSVALHGRQRYLRNDWTNMRVIEDILKVAVEDSDEALDSFNQRLPCPEKIAVE